MAIQLIVWRDGVGVPKNSDPAGAVRQGQIEGPHRRAGRARHGVVAHAAVAV